MVSFEGNKNTIYSGRSIFSWIRIFAIPANSQNKLRQTLVSTISNLANAATQFSNNIGSYDHAMAIAIANFGIH